MNRARKFLRGFTLIELLVVIAIIAVLISLLVPAVQKVRTAASRTQSENNLKQIVLASHSFNDAYHFLPPPYGNSPPFTFGPNSAQGNAFFFILPFIEQQNLYNQSLTKYQWGNFNIYNSTAVNGRIDLYINPADYTITQTSTNPISYSANAAALGYGSKQTFKNITDGASNTIFFAEALGQCSQGLTFTGFNWKGSYPNWTGYTETFSSGSMSPVYWNSQSYPAAPYYYYFYGIPLIQPVIGSQGQVYTLDYDSTTGQLTWSPSMPNFSSPGTCLRPSTPYERELVAMGDGRVISLNSTISVSTWNAANTPSSGDTMGPDFE